MRIVSSAVVSWEAVVGPVGGPLILGAIDAAAEAVIDGATTEGPDHVPVVPQALIPMMVAAEITAKPRRWCVFFVVMGFPFLGANKKMLNTFGWLGQSEVYAGWLEVRVAYTTVFSRYSPVARS